MVSELIVARISEDLNINKDQVLQTVKLFDDGNTVPFIARYRKEMTGGLSDEEVRALQEKLHQYRNLENRREDILRLIDSQGNLSEEIRTQIEKAVTVTELDDIYRPFRPKKQTRASLARDKGLEPLAQEILQGMVEPGELAKLYLDREKELFTIEDVLKGAMDIIAEVIADNAGVRKALRSIIYQTGFVSLKRKKDTAVHTFNDYDGFREAINRIKPHRILAVNRGIKEKVLKLAIEVNEEKALKAVKSFFITEDQNDGCVKLIDAAASDSYKRLIMPSVEREIWQSMLDKAISGALQVFRENLKNKLLIPPVRNRRVLGWDPGFRTGCKLACVSETGELLETAAVFPTAPKRDLTGAAEKVVHMVEKHRIDSIAIGNGTASRESEEFIAGLITDKKLTLEYTIVNEAGASVYSASPAAKKEFPQMDVAGRSAVSIARRLQDPLAELVKIDPQSIGIGQYQHDMPAKELDAALSGTVEGCVNKVGVDLNTASAALLSYTAGINAPVAEKIVSYRNEIGNFTSRTQLLAVDGLGAKAFRQCAGFLRLPESENYLERSAVHPESYELAERLMDKLEIKPEKLGFAEGIPCLTNGEIKELANSLDAGEPTIKDILDEFRKPGRDPRDDLPRPVFLRTVTKIEDIVPGMVLKGIVRNIVDFGVFVDIGVHHDGLVHVSEISHRYIKHPLEVLQLESVVKVIVLSVDRERSRISLSIKQAEETSIDHSQ